MKKIKGNLLDLLEDGTFDVIVHGCNCHHNMSGGIAAQIVKRWPKVLEHDKLLTDYGRVKKLGTFRFGALLPCIVNAYTQFNPGADANLSAIRSAFTSMEESMMFAKLKIGIPAIGCGIGGLEWADVEPVLDTIDLDITLVEYEL